MSLEGDKSSATAANNRRSGHNIQNQLLRKPSQSPQRPLRSILKKAALTSGESSPPTSSPKPLTELVEIPKITAQGRPIPLPQPALHRRMTSTGLGTNDVENHHGAVKAENIRPRGQNVSKGDAETFNARKRLSTIAEVSTLASERQSIISGSPNPCSPNLVNESDDNTVCGAATIAGNKSPKGGNAEQSNGDIPHGSASNTSIETMNRSVGADRPTSPISPGHPASNVHDSIASSSRAVSARVFGGLNAPALGRVPPSIKALQRDGKASRFIYELEANSNLRHPIHPLERPHRTETVYQGNNIKALQNESKGKVHSPAPALREPRNNIAAHISQGMLEERQGHTNLASGNLNMDGPSNTTAEVESFNRPRSHSISLAHATQALRSLTRNIAHTHLAQRVLVRYVPTWHATEPLHKSRSFDFWTEMFRRRQNGAERRRHSV